MGIFSRSRHDKEPLEEITGEERMLRYLHLLGTLPPTVIEKAHASVFKAVPVEQRREIAHRLQPPSSDTERDAASDDPRVLAALFARAVERRAQPQKEIASESEAIADADPLEVLRDVGAADLVASRLITDYAVSTYFLYGAGSQTLDQQPAWVVEMVNLAGGEAGGQVMDSLSGFAGGNDAYRGSAVTGGAG
ncbi:hypothetical protein ABZ477_16680 [Microbacterium sp. NPDC019599]|uniref:hypothetical protein n=1 Tax=Microbacterium sp. NPDC019599 TaxID=3154690 RepID=UPI0033DA0A87